MPYKLKADLVTWRQRRWAQNREALYRIAHPGDVFVSPRGTMQSAPARWPVELLGYNHFGGRYFAVVWSLEAGKAHYLPMRQRDAS